MIVVDVLTCTSYACEVVKMDLVAAASVPTKDTWKRDDPTDGGQNVPRIPDGKMEEGFFPVLEPRG